MKVSVVIPNYNYARYLKERLRSVLGQTMRDLEVLYIDDASTDDSNEVAGDFARNDPRMSLCHRATNSGGPYWTWNEAAKRARGDWLWFAGADDTASANFLEELLALAGRHPEAGIVRSDYLRMDADSRVVGRASADRVRRWKDGADYYGSGPAEIGYAALSPYGTASSLLVRRDVFEACGGFDTRIPLSADTLFYVRAVAMSGMAYCARPLSAYRDHPASATRASSVGATAISKCFSMATALEILAGQGIVDTDECSGLRRYIRFRLNSARCATGGRLPPEVQWMIRPILDQVPGFAGAGWLENNE